MLFRSPDGCFSRGVIKVESQEALLKATAELFEHSVLLLAQEFFYTEYDWRIGVLNRKPIFACQYFMSKGHWQIYNHKAIGQDINGECRTLAVHEAPKAVVELAVSFSAAPCCAPVVGHWTASRSASGQVSTCH